MGKKDFLNERNKMKKTVLVFVVLCFVGAGGCDLTDAQKIVADVNTQITDPESDLQQTVEVVGTVAKQAQRIVVLLPAIPGAGLIGGISSLVLLIIAVLQGLAKKKVKKTLSAVVKAIDTQSDEEIPESAKQSIKAEVAYNLRDNKIYPEGRVLIQEAKNK